MPATLVVLFRLIGRLCRGYDSRTGELGTASAVSVLARTRKREQVRPRDRLFWVCFASAWRGWRTALVVVRPDTVVRWHRQWLSRRWTRRSARGRPGRSSLLAIDKGTNTVKRLDVSVHYIYEG